LRNVRGILFVGTAREAPFSGYEIHMGVTQGPALARPALSIDGRPEGAVSSDDRILGTYVHGLFDRREAGAAILRWAGLPDAAEVDLHASPIPHPCPNALYEQAIAAFIEKAKAAGVTRVAFGDLFLEDIRRYRERQFAGSGVELLFPIWGLPTRALAEQMTASGLRAWIVCVDPRRAPREWAGRVFDADFVKSVPYGIDPCGENGEFHTFVFEGPMLRMPVAARPGKVTEDGGFV